MYQGVKLSKRQAELIDWLQRGRHDYEQAFYQYKSRRKNAIADARGRTRTWFNNTLKTLKRMGLCENIPYVLRHITWHNPGLAASKAEFTSLSIQDEFREHKQVRDVITKHK